MIYRAQGVRGISRVAVTTSGRCVSAGRARSLLDRASPGAPNTSVHESASSDLRLSGPPADRAKGVK